MTRPAFAGFANYIFCLYFPFSSYNVWLAYHSSFAPSVFHWMLFESAPNWGQ